MRRECLQSGVQSWWPLGWQISWVKCGFHPTRSSCFFMSVSTAQFSTIGELCTDQFVTSTSPFPLPPGIPRAFHTLPSPGSRAFGFKNRCGCGEFDSYSRKVGNLTDYTWQPNTSNEKMLTIYFVRDRMTDQKWAVETQGHFWMKVWNSLIQF